MASNSSSNSSPYPTAAISQNLKVNPYRRRSPSISTEGDGIYSRDGGMEAHHYHGLSICCYAPLLPFAEHFTCSDCSTLFNKVSEKHTNIF